MSIFDPIEKTHEELLKDETILINSSNEKLLNIINMLHKNIFNKIWNSEKFTPQEIFDMYGNEAVQLFVLSHGLQTILKEANPEYELLSPTYEYTINPDGTVEIGNEIVEEDND